MVLSGRYVFLISLTMRTFRVDWIDPRVYADFMRNLTNVSEPQVFLFWGKNFYEVVGYSVPKEKCIYFIET